MMVAKGGSVVDFAYELGKEYEKRATNCCQSTIAALQDSIEFVPKDDVLLRAGSAFAGGFAFTEQGLCGALVGAAMVIGCLYGRGRKEFRKHAQLLPNEVDFVNEGAPAWDLAYELFERYMMEYGSPLCKDVMTRVFGAHPDRIRPDSPVRYEWTKRFGGHESGGCCEVVGKAVRWAAELILRKGPPKEGVDGRDA